MQGEASKPNQDSHTILQIPCNKIDVMTDSLPTPAPPVLPFCIRYVLERELEEPWIHKHGRAHSKRSSIHSILLHELGEPWRRAKALRATRGQKVSKLE